MTEIQKELEKQVLDKIEADLKAEFGEYWQEAQQDLSVWTKLLVRLFVEPDSAGRRLAERYAKDALCVLKAKYEYKIASDSWKLIEKILTIVLDVALIFAKKIII